MKILYFRSNHTRQSLLRFFINSSLFIFPDGISNSLLYEIVLSDTLETSDGSSLNANCTRDYSSNALSKTDSMATEMEEAMEMLCNDGSAEVLTYASSFTSLGNQVNISMKNDELVTYH